MSLRRATVAILCVVAIAVALPAFAHNMSPRATVSQMVGMTNVSVDYGRPGVKDRAVWGELVPYGEVWKTGADKMTTITFDKPIKVEGHELAAGTYGILSIPGDKTFTLMITKRADIHRPNTYTEADDALRLELVPEMAEHQERLQFTFESLEMASADLVLHWEKKKLRLRLEEVGGHP